MKFKGLGDAHAKDALPCTDKIVCKRKNGI